MKLRELLPTLITSRKVSGIITYISFNFNEGIEILPETKIEYFEDAFLDAQVKYFRFSDTQKALIVKCE